MPSQISGQAPQPSKNVARRPRKPHAVGAAEGLAQMGGTVAHSAGHAAHNAKHGIGRAGRKIGKLVASIDVNPFD
jgi:hypothetical protein